MSTAKRSVREKVPRVMFSQRLKEKMNRKCSKIPIKTMEIVRTTNEYKKTKEMTLEDFEIKAKDVAENQTCPLFRKHSPKNFMIARFDSKCPQKITAMILENGVDVRYEGEEDVERYVFFGHSASQLRQRVCYLYSIKLGPAEDIINEFGDFSRIKTVAKRAARIGLLFSTAGETVSLRAEDIRRIDDVERNSHTFTDGCGYISPAVAEEVTALLGIADKYRHQKYKYPSVFQVRLMGCKGVLAVKPSLEKGVEIRKSMEKFSWSLPEPFPLGVVDKGYSKPYEVGSLNKQFIWLLSALGITDDVFLEKQQKYFKDMASLTHDKKTAFTYLCAFGEISIAERLLEADNFDSDMIAKVKCIQQRAYGVNSEKSPAEKLKIPVEQSRNVYGISDPTEEMLQYGTCFFQPTIRGHTKPVLGKVVVAKNPCYSPGDIRILKCVDVPSCHHLVDCIVFPTTGKRPHPDEIAGSDLDGDKFFVCWDSDLIPYEEKDPSSYPPAKILPMNQIRQKDMIEYFARYSNATVSKIDSLFASWADRKGILSTECKILSALFSRAIDSAKTGEKVNIPNHLNLPTDAAPQKGEETFVWHKMASRARLFLEDRVKDFKVNNLIQLTEDTVTSILRNQEINVSEYQLFRFLYKWAEQERDAEKRVDDIAEKYIDFTEFTSEQLRLAQIDCPGLNPLVLFNPFVRSEILSDHDQQILVSELENYPRFSMVYRTDAESLSWGVLNNVLTSILVKILVFKFLLGSMEWVFALSLSQKLASRETLEFNEAEDPLPCAFLFIHQDNPVSERLQLKEGYSLSLDDKRLQIYQTTKNRTFISFNINDANDLSIVSIDLNRFNPRLANKYGVRLRKEAFISLEVYCLDPMGDPIPRIHPTDPPTVKQVQSSRQDAANNLFTATKEDFPSLGQEHGGIFMESERELSKLYDLYESGKLKTRDFQEMKELLVKMKEYPQERHEWACKLESLVDKSAIPLGNPDDYLRLLIYLLEGLRKCSPSTLIGNKVNVTLLDRMRRVLENMEQKEVRFNVENVFGLFDTLLFMHDWHTSVFVVQLLKQGRFPIAKDEFLPHENAVAYFFHWTSLVYMEILEEIREQEQLELKYTETQSIIQGVATGKSEADSSECTIFVEKGESSFLPGDFLALSPINSRFVFSERKYIAEVKSISGMLISIDIVWPNEESLIQHVIQQHRWYITPFPNLVSCKRMLDSLRKLCTAKSLNDVGVFSKLLDKWKLKVEDRREIRDSAQTFDEPAQVPCDLNNSQRTAVQQASNNFLTLIQGPPGTGKSKTSAYIIQTFLAQDSEGKILAVAETNEGVDNLLEKIIDVGRSIPDHELLRLGSSTWTVRENLRKYTLETRYAERSEGKRVKENKMDSKVVKAILKQAKVVCTTCISAGSKILEKTQFPRLLVDEASQATEPAILVPICNECKVLVLVGDDKQLPPTVKCQTAKELSETTFNRLRQAGEPVYLLDTQYRMHPAIAAFPANQFYDGKLKDGVKEKQRPAPAGFCWPNSKRPIAFVEMGNDARETGGRSKRNTKEVAVAKRIVEELLQDGNLRPEEVGVVTPYKAQVKLLTEKLQGRFPKVSVRTVDGFQGQERELIVFSAVRCNAGGHLGFLDDDQRMNVLLTRARRGLIIIGSGDTLKSDNSSSWSKWVNWVEQEKLTVDSATFLPVTNASVEHGGQRKGQIQERGKSHGRGRGQKHGRGRGQGRRGGRQ